MNIETLAARPSGMRYSFPVSVALHLLLFLLAWQLAERVVTTGPVVIDLVFSEPERKPPPPKPEPKLWQEPEPDDVTPLQEPQTVEQAREKLPDEELNPLLPRNGNPRELDDTRPNIATMARSDVELPGMRVSGVKRTDDGSSTFMGAPHGVDRKVRIDMPDNNLFPHYGKGNKHQLGGREGGTGDGSGEANRFRPRPSQRTNPDGDVFQKPIVKKKKTEDLAAEVTRDNRGTWRRIENVGPLAHLNAQCYGVPANALIYYSEFKFRCADNQIIEAWRKE
jgi:hypothetical protein